MRANFALRKNLFLLFVLVGCVFTSDEANEDDSDTIYEIEENCSSEDRVSVQDSNSSTNGHTLEYTTIKYYFIPPPPANQTITLNSSNLNLVNTSQPLKILIHGIGEYQKHVWIDKMATLYHTKGAYNVLSVDWSVISTTDSFYVASVVNSVGEAVGEFIVEISQNRFDYLSDVHLIGSNVGAQVGGAAGKTVAEKTNGKVDRITGLNPTQPENLQILDKDDADFVDVIHTSVVLGDKSCGTVDFYVTGDDPNYVICPNDTCGDTVAEEMFISTIEDRDRYQGISCYNVSDYVDRLCSVANSAVMGEDVPRSISGPYLVASATNLPIHRFILLLISVAPLLLVGAL